MIGEFVPVVKTKTVNYWLNKVWQARKASLGFDEKIPDLDEYAWMIFNKPQARDVKKEMSRAYVPTSYLTMLQNEAQEYVHQLEKKSAKHYKSYAKLLSVVVGSLKVAIEKADESFYYKYHNGKLIEPYVMSGVTPVVMPPEPKQNPNKRKTRKPRKSKKK